MKYSKCYIITEEWFKEADVILNWFDQYDMEKFLAKTNRYYFKRAYMDFIGWLESNDPQANIPSRKRFNSRVKGISNNYGYITERDEKGFYIAQNRLM